MNYQGYKQRKHGNFLIHGMFQISPCTQMADFLESISFLLDKKMAKLALHTPLTIGRADIQQ